MFLYSHIVNLVNYFLIQGSFISVLVLIVAKALFSKKIDVRLPINIMKWMFITYAFLSAINTLAIMIQEYFSTTDHVFFTRITGPYWWAYWMMLSGTCILPFILLIKKLGRNIYMVFLASIFINIVFLFDLFIYRLWAVWWTIILKGFVVGIIVLGVGMWKMKTAKHYAH